MEPTIEFEPFMKTGFKLLRRTKDSNSVKHLLKHFEDSIQELYGSSRRPTNAAKKLTVPTALLSKDLGIEQIDVRYNKLRDTFTVQYTFTNFVVR